MGTHATRLGVLCVAVALALGGCTSKEPGADKPGLAERGTTFTTAKPTRQDLANRISLAGSVTLNPIFGLVSPVSGQVRYWNVTAPRSTPTRPTRVATVWAKGKPHYVQVPAGATFAGRLMDDRATVSAGMPIVSAKYVGYGIVAEIQASQAYQVTDGLAEVQAQITNGPGPFKCKVLGTIAALPAGTVPEPPAPTLPEPDPSMPPVVKMPTVVEPGIEPSESTGMRVVCIAPKGTKLINGAAATLELITARADNVLVLPVEAVAGSQGKGKVDVILPDGTRETRDVVLGLTDGKVVEIKSGLTGDETVAVPGPNLPAAPEGQQPGYGK